MFIVLVSSNGYGKGKTTFANYLKDKLNKEGVYTVIIPFAEKLKETAYFMGWDGKKDERGRKLLQQLGTEVGRNYDPYLWAKWVYTKIKKDVEMGISPTVVIIDDWRFKNEAEYFESLPEFKVIKVRILSGKNEETHISERDLDDYTDFDYIIENTFSSPKDDFSSIANKIVENILNQLNYFTN